MGLCPISGVNVHRYFIKLLQAGHGVEKHHYNTSSFDSLHGPAHDVWCETLKILEHTHSKGLTQNLVSIFVKTIFDLLS
jgi:hypothetical protein